VGSLGAFLVAVFGGGILWQWVTFLVLSAVAFAGSRKFARRVYRGPTEFGVGAERYGGMRAYVIETIDAAAATGMVRIDREEWRAESADGTVIPQDTWSEIVKVDGTRMVVKPATGSADTGSADRPAEFESPADAAIREAEEDEEAE
jgi:membrane protein implicated in regulation of membrane protease activity